MKIRVQGRCASVMVYYYLQAYNLFTIEADS